MKTAPLPHNESARLKKLKTYGILDSPQESEYDEIVKLASLICKTPISSVTLIDEKRQWHKARLGLEDQESSRDISFCSHAVGMNDMLIVPDATQDERFFDNPLVTGTPDIRFYAGMPLRSSDGYALGTLCVIDRTPRLLTPLQLEALKILSGQVVKYMELRRRTISLSRLHELDTRLLSVISHDIRSPLNSLKGLISLVEEYGLSQMEFKSNLPQIKSKINEVVDLLSQMLEWSTSQFDQNALNTVGVRLWQIIDETISLNHTHFQHKKNTVLNLVDPLLTVRADEHMLTFIIRNLLLNANKFSELSTIRVTAKHNNNRIEICVSDEGMGISPDRLSSLFSWEHRQSSQGTNGEKGSGFALLIAKDFIEKNGGSIRVESKLGQGTQFYISLPV